MAREVEKVLDGLADEGVQMAAEALYVHVLFASDLLSAVAVWREAAPAERREGFSFVDAEVAARWRPVS